MKIVLIAEKPFLGRVMLQALLELEPNLDRRFLTVAYANEFIHLNNAFTFPHDTPYSSFPIVRAPSYKPFSFDWSCRPVKGLQSFEVEDDPEHIGFTRHPTPVAEWIWKVTDAEVVNSIQQADLIYSAIDWCDGGLHVSQRLQDWVRELRPCADIRFVRYFDMQHQALKKAILAAGPLPELADLAHASRVRRYFDYNYLMNAQSILGLTFSRAIGSPMKRTLAKNALQLLFFMRDGKRMSDGTLIEHMERSWKGTGKYPNAVLDGRGMGNCASRWAIISHLIDEGMLERVTSPRQSVSISYEGERLLRHLHPDCEDVDQLHRLASWTKLPYAEATQKIDKYILTFFGKQKRFLPKHHHQFESRPNLHFPKAA